MEAPATLRATADGSHTLYSARYRQSFHSEHGALSEARHVFLQASGVLEKLEAAQAAQVLEVGFGTGLNFFVSADAAQQQGAPLGYSALERELPPAAVVRALGYDRCLHAPAIFEHYLDWRARHGDVVAQGSYRLEPLPGVRLELLIGEATEQALPAGAFDAVYQDAFSPDANPELWQEAFLEKLYHTLKAGGTLSTYSVKGEVRRCLARLGFEVEKRPGPPGGKREMLLARKAA